MALTSVAFIHRSTSVFPVLGVYSVVFRDRTISDVNQVKTCQYNWTHNVSINHNTFKVTLSGSHLWTMNFQGIVEAHECILEGSRAPNGHHGPQLR